MIRAIFLSCKNGEDMRFSIGSKDGSKAVGGSRGRSPPISKHNDLRNFPFWQHGDDMMLFNWEHGWTKRLQE